MIRILKISLEGNQKICFNFSDNKDKTIDFEPFIGEVILSEPLSDPTYFQKVKLYENGRGIFWSNGFDFCPDFLHQYHVDEMELVKGKI